MNLKALLLSSDEKTVRVLRRVLSDLEVGIEHCTGLEAALHRITRQRYEAIIVDSADRKGAANVLRASKAAPVNKRALSIVLVENNVGLKGGFEMGAHFVLHKPLAVERAKASFRAVRALMKSERRLQMRVPVEIPIVCIGAARYPARTIDLCEGGMAIRFTERKAKESSLRFTLELPGPHDKSSAERLDVAGELAWEGDEYRAGVRFKDVTDSQRAILRKWLATHLPEHENDPPVICRLKNLSDGACYLMTDSPFPVSSRVILSLQTIDPGLRAFGVVRLTHPEFGMGVEFLRATAEQQKQTQQLVALLRVGGDSLEIHVDPDGLEVRDEESGLAPTRVEDALVRFFQQHAEVPVEVFLEQMKNQRQLQPTS